MVVKFILHCSLVIQPGLQQAALNALCFQATPIAQALLLCQGCPSPISLIIQLFNYTSAISPSWCRSLSADTGAAETDWTHPCARGVPVSSPFEVTVVTCPALPPRVVRLRNYFVYENILVSVKWNCHFVN